MGNREEPVCVVFECTLVGLAATENFEVAVLEARALENNMKEFSYPRQSPVWGPIWLS